MSKFHLSALIFLFSLSVQAQSQLTYPYVVQYKGQVIYSDKDENKRSVAVKSNFIDTADVETGENSEVEIMIDPTRKIFLGPLTNVKIPSISRENHEVSDLILVKGFLRWKATESTGHEYNIKLHSDLFSTDLPKGHVSFEYFRSRARLEVKVFSGQMTFAQLNGEFPVELEDGDGVNFTGRINEGEIEYDFLLQGRKIPKGKLSAKYRLSKADMEKYSDESEKRKILEEKRLAEQKKLAIKKKIEKQICQNPAAELNDCFWKIEKNECVRMRCSPNGQWVDRVILPKKDSQNCRASGQIKKCNY